MRLIGIFEDPGYYALADAALAFFDRRTDLHRSAVAFASGPPSSGGSTGGGPAGGSAGSDGSGAPEPAKISTDISLVWLDCSDPEAHALADVIMRGVSAGLKRYLAERPLSLEACPERSLFVNPPSHPAPASRPAQGIPARIPPCPQPPPPPTNACGTPSRGACA